MASKVFILLCLALIDIDVFAQSPPLPGGDGTCQQGQEGETSTDGCQICVCVTGLFGRVRCKFETDSTNPACPPETEGTCQAGDASFFPCVVCMCEADGQTCNWARNTTCDLEKPDVSVGVPCELSTSLTPPCFICACTTTEECFWELDPKCSSPDTGDSKDTCIPRDDKPEGCPECSCLNNGCYPCLGFWEACYWYDNEQDCLDYGGIDDYTCVSTDSVPDQCPDCVCLNFVECGTCTDGGEECFWYEDVNECHGFIDYFTCSSTDTPHDDCPDCICLNLECETCVGEMECYWYEDMKECQTYDDYTCSPGNTEPEHCPGCACLNIDCGQCSELEDCYWHKDEDECRDFFHHFLCSPTDPPRDDCPNCVCLNLECHACVGEMECYWFDNMKECEAPTYPSYDIDDFSCTRGDTKPTYCPGCMCMNNGCNQCLGPWQECHWFEDQQDCQDHHNNIDDYTCSPADDSLAECPNCVCLTYECGECVGEQECYWYEDIQECEDYIVDYHLCSLGDIKPKDCPECRCLNNNCNPCMGFGGRQECYWYKADDECHGVIDDYVCSPGDDKPLICPECVCLNNGCTDCMDQEDCYWFADVQECQDYDVGVFTCAHGDTPPEYCESCVCLNFECGRCLEGHDCYWFKDLGECREHPIDAFICSAGDDVPKFCEDCDCLNTECGDCSDGQECHWYQDVKQCQTILASFPCSAGDSPSSTSPDNVCLNNRCGECRMFQECYWYNNQQECTDYVDGDYTCTEGENPPAYCPGCTCINLECGRCTGEMKCFWVEDVTECQDSILSEKPCLSGDSPPEFCSTCVCMNDGCQQCTDSQECYWYDNEEECQDYISGDHSCTPGQRPPTFCPECRCLNDNCGRCVSLFGQQQSCSWYEDVKQCEEYAYYGDFLCTPRDTVPEDCPDCSCLNTDCSGCIGRQECYWFDSEEQCEIYIDNDKSCTPKDQPASDCQDCICLNDQCEKCVGQQECSWFYNTDECEPKVNVDGDITCPGNRPVTPCGSVNPCELVGECTTNQDLVCRKYECSRCQAKFYSADGTATPCPASGAPDAQPGSQGPEQEFCLIEVRGRPDRRIKVGRSYDNPNRPCETCFCASNGVTRCPVSSEDNPCGRHQRVQMKLDTPVEECEAIKTDLERLETFLDMLVLEVSEALKIPAVFLRDIEMRCGSIVIDVTVVENVPGVDESVDVDAKVEDFQKQVEGGTLTVEYEGKSFASIQDSFVQIDDRKPFSNTKDIIIAVFACVVLIALIASITKCYLNSRKEKKSTESARPDVAMQAQPGYTNNGYGDVEHRNGHDGNNQTYQPPPYESCGAPNAPIDNAYEDLKK